MEGIHEWKQNDGQQSGNRNRDNLKHPPNSDPKGRRQHVTSLMGKALGLKTAPYQYEEQRSQHQAQSFIAHIQSFQFGIKKGWLPKVWPSLFRRLHVLLDIGLIHPIEQVWNIVAMCPTKYPESLIGLPIREAPLAHGQIGYSQKVLAIFF